MPENNDKNGYMAAQIEEENYYGEAGIFEQEGLYENEGSIFEEEADSLEVDDYQDENSARQSVVQYEKKSNMENLSAILQFYSTIRENEKIGMKDLFQGQKNETQKTNLKLLHDAVIPTGEITNKKDYEKHVRAREALLLWCVIHCEKTLLSRFSKDEDCKETICYSAHLATQCLKNIRDSIYKYFQLPEEERKNYLPDGMGLRQFFYYKTLDITREEFRRMDRQNLIKIKPKYIERVRELLKKKGEDLIEKKNGTYMHRYTPLEFNNKESDEDFINPEVTVIIQEMLEQAEKTRLNMEIARLLEEIFDYMKNKNLLNDLQQEFFERIYFNHEKPGEVENDWKRKGIAYDYTSIGNFSTALKNTLIKTIRSKPEWEQVFVEARLLDRR